MAATVAGFGANYAARDFRLGNRQATVALFLARFLDSVLPYTMITPCMNNISIINVSRRHGSSLELQSTPYRAEDIHIVGSSWFWSNFAESSNPYHAIIPAS
jgi:hypothetical protein